MEDPPARHVPPLPSYGVATIGGLSLVCLALATALGVALSAPSEAAATARPADAALVSDTLAPEPAASAVLVAPTFSANPNPIPVDLITQLEAASEQPVEVELSSLLGAVQHGFGARSARLEPTLHSYADRMAARFAWSADTFHVAVTAPSADLAHARAALLLRLFEAAASDGRLRVRAGTGPHALTLVSD